MSDLDSNGRRCELCQSPAVARCDWRDERPTAVKAEDIRVNDLIITPIYRTTVEVYKVIVHDFVAPKWIVIYVASRDGRKWTYEKQPGEFVTALRIGPCGKPVCYGHVRELGDGFHYCADHWHTWETVH